MLLFIVCKYLIALFFINEEVQVLAKNIKQGNMGEAYVTDKLINRALKKKMKLDDTLKSLSHFTTR